jgi:ribosomal protein L40E
MAYCKKCGAQNPADAKFCTQCSASLQDIRSMATEKRSAFPTAAGILAIIAACIIIIFGIIYMAEFVSGRTEYQNYYPYDYYTVNPPEYFVAGLFGLLGFAFGLTAGIITLKRRLFAMAIFGMALMTVAGILFFVEPVVGIIFGTPVLVLTILSVIFTGIRKREFT